MDASKTLLALGWGRGAHAPAAQQTPPASSPVQQEQREATGAPPAPRQAGAAPWAEIVAEQNARLGLQPGANPHGPQRAAVQPPPAPRQEGAADWAEIAAAANARLPAHARIPGKETRSC